MNCLSKTIDTLDGKTLQVDVLPSGDVQLTLFDWGDRYSEGKYCIEHVAAGRFEKKLGSCVIPLQSIREIRVIRG